MSNPPFGSPLYNEEDDFTFPIQPQNYEPINYPPLIIEDHPNTLPNSASSLPPPPMSEFQDLSMFLGDDIELDYTLIGQHDHSNIHHSINWANPTHEHAIGLNHHVVHQGSVEGSSLGHHHEMPPYYDPTMMTAMMTTTTLVDDQAPAPAPGAGGSGGGGGEEGSSSKKLDHNAREKVRRMKINETFYTLRSLLPESKKAKKKWSAPYIIDRALDYIPQLQAEVEKLTLEKSSMLSVLGNKQHQVVALASSTGDNNQGVNKDNTTLTVSINEVRRGEVIIQICQHNDKVGILSTLIEKLEGEGVHVLGTSSQRASEDRSCFHLHVQMGENPVEADYVAVLHKKIIFWLS